MLCWRRCLARRKEGDEGMGCRQLVRRTVDFDDTRLVFGLVLIWLGEFWTCGFSLPGHVLLRVDGVLLSVVISLSYL